MEKVFTDKLPEYIYHVTDDASAQSIVKKGIIPGNGENMIMVADEREGMLFLCEESDIPYWSILLGKSKVIKIRTDNLNVKDFKKYEYGSYCEYFTKKAIAPDICRIEPMFILRSNAMEELCVNYTLCLSELIVEMTKLGTYPERCATKSYDIDVRAKSIINIMENRLDFTVVSDEYLINKIAAEGDDGEYTLCDMYCVNERFGANRLWEQLPLYDFSNPTLSRMKDAYLMVYNFVRDWFSWAGRIQTGGYTG